MSWNQWTYNAGHPQNTMTTNVPASTSVAANVGSVSSPAVGMSYTPAVPPPNSYTPAQFAALPAAQQYAIQQNWQQWQTYHQQYAQWHAQYGEQYQREMQAKLGIVAPTLPFVPPMPPYSAPIPPSAYSIPPPPTGHATYTDHSSIPAVASRPPPPPPPPLPDSVEEKRDLNVENKCVGDISSEIERNSNPKNLGRNIGQQFGQQKEEHNSQQHELSDWKPKSDPRSFNSQRFGIGEKNLAEHGNYDNTRELNCNYNDKGSSAWQFSSNKSTEIQNTAVQNINQQQSLDQSFDCTSLDILEEEKTREERAFDEQFKKWEEEFENWKMQNANHPDKKAYKEYEMKFEDCRRKLLERRELMRRRKLERKLKEEQARRMKEKEKTDLRKIENRPVEEKAENQNNDQNSISNEDNELKPEDGEKSNEPLLQECVKASSKDMESDVVEFLKTTKSDGIPGLDLVSNAEEKEQKDNNDVAEIIDLDVEGRDRAEERPTKSTTEEKSVLNENNMNIQKPSDTKTEVVAEDEEGQNKKEIPSLLYQKFEKPSMSSPNEEHTTASNFNNAGITEGMNRNLTRQHSNQSFGQFLQNNMPSLETAANSANGSNQNMLSVDKRNVPSTITELANALSDPNVLALITAAIGNTGNLSSANSVSNKAGPSKISPWVAGKEPFLYKNQFGAQQQSGNFRDFGNQSIWNNNTATIQWCNKNIDDNPSNNSPWKTCDIRRNSNQNWSACRDLGERKTIPWQDDVDMRQNVFER